MKWLKTMSQQYLKPSFILWHLFGCHREAHKPDGARQHEFSEHGCSAMEQGKCPYWMRINFVALESLQNARFVSAELFYNMLFMYACPFACILYVSVSICINK